MCIIKSTGFLKNGAAMNPPCSVDPNDTVKLEAEVMFSVAELYHQYKCEWKILLPTNAETKLYSPLSAPVWTSGTLVFYSPDFVKPIPQGTYTLIWTTIYDEYGNTICAV